MIARIPFIITLIAFNSISALDSPLADGFRSARFHRQWMRAHSTQHRGAAGRRAAAALAGMLGLMTACASGPPPLHPGLWEVRGQITENHGSKRTDFQYQLCRDHQYDNSQIAAIRHRDGCATRVEKTGARKFTASSTCNISGIAIVSQGVTQYPSNSRLHSETQATYAPAFNGTTDETIIQDQTFLGVCPAGMKTGDLIGADGLVRHQN